MLNAFKAWQIPTFFVCLAFFQIATISIGAKTPLAVVKINQSNNGRRNSKVKKTRHQNVTHLWEFLLELLENDNLCTIISWSRREFKEFKLKKPEEVARRWGLLRQRKGMNYEKLSRALRFYYGQGIIQKVSVENIYCNLKDVLTCGYVSQAFTY